MKNDLRSDWPRHAVDGETRISNASAGDSSQMRVADTQAAVGNPLLLGDAGALTNPLFSALLRNYPPDVIRHHGFDWRP